ncbi:CIC11C00000001919 [Sungouiella intermedia]|uniref:CIC11C00000001919 n=1 Tax=Sungouiella intermedia TaxID=45354 RepID=A0A1L0BFE9_9ASCO|nr:CIC11C00000001919 [[Candida] intermedia]
MSEKKSDQHSETFSIASTKASIKSKLNFLKRKEKCKEENTMNLTSTPKKEKSPSINYQATATYMSLK